MSIAAQKGNGNKVNTHAHSCAKLNSIEKNNET